jgi:hypothetical protein
MSGFVTSSGPTRSNPAHAKKKKTARVRPVSAGGMARTSDQLRELLLEGKTILREPIKFLWRDHLDGGINDLREKAMVSEERVKTERRWWSTLEPTNSSSLPCLFISSFTS